MTQSSTFEHILVFDMIMVILLTAYGTSTNTAPAIQQAINTLFGAWPSLSSCTTNFFGVTIPCDPISHATLQLLLWGGSVLDRIGAFFALMYQLVVLTGFSTGIPYIGPLLISFQIMLLIFGYRMLRSGGS